MVAFTDGSFEIPQVGAGNFLQNPSSCPWFFNGTAGIAGNSSTLHNAGAPNGVQAAYVQGKGFFYQNFKINSGIYTISLAAAYPSGGSANTINVVLDSIPVFQFCPQSTLYNYLSSSTFSVSQNSHTLTFTGSNGTTFIDNIVFNLVTNPPTPPPPPPLSDGVNELGGFSYQPQDDDVGASS